MGTWPSWGGGGARQAHAWQGGSGYYISKPPGRPLGTLLFTWYVFCQPSAQAVDSLQLKPDCCLLPIPVQGAAVQAGWPGPA